jgi:hypothetical protein
MHPRVSEDPARIRGLVPRSAADPTQIGQVVVTLVADAQDAMPNGGSVRVRVYSVESRLRVKAGRAARGTLHMPRGRRWRRRYGARDGAALSARQGGRPDLRRTGSFAAVEVAKIDRTDHLFAVLAHTVATPACRGQATTALARLDAGFRTFTVGFIAAGAATATLLLVGGAMAAGEAEQEQHRERAERTKQVSTPSRPRRPEVELQARSVGVLHGLPFGTALWCSSHRHDE